MPERKFVTTLTFSHFHGNVNDAVKEERRIAEFLRGRDFEVESSTADSGWPWVVHDGFNHEPGGRLP